MATYSSKFSGLTFIVIPKQRIRGVDGTFKTIVGKSAKFKHGRFSTEDQEIIDKLDAYSKNHPDEVQKIDGALKALGKVREMLQKEDVQTQKAVSEYMSKRKKQFMKKMDNIKNKPKEEIKKVKREIN